jgi:CRISPR system Cascade subunit CasA
MQQFSLIREPWIPVRTKANELREVGLLEVFTLADQFFRVESESPLEMAAMYRFLLAILHRAIPDITDGARATWFKNGLPVEQVSAYLERYQDRLFLFGEKPFLQIPNLRNEGYIKHWSELAAELGSGNTTMLFNETRRENSTEPTYPTTPARALRKLLEYQTFALGGLIRRFIASAPAAPSATAAMVVIQGENLLQTLCLNLRSQTQNLWQQDHALWEHDPVSIAYLKTDPTESARGIVHRYCWLTRSLELLPEIEDGQIVVRFVARASGIRLREDFNVRDSMMTLREDKNGRRPLSLNTEKAFWRDYAALLPESGANGTNPAPVTEAATNLLRQLERKTRPQQGVRLLVLGQANDQGKLEMWRAEMHRLPEVLIATRNVREFIADCLGQSEEAGRALRSSTFNFARLLILMTSSRPLKGDDINKMQASLGAQIVYWSALERDFAQLLESLNEGYDANSVKVAWLKQVHDAASQAWQHALKAAGLTPRAHQAAAQSERVLLIHLATLRKQFQKPNGEAT